MSNKKHPKEDELDDPYDLGEDEVPAIYFDPEEEETDNDSLEEFFNDEDYFDDND